jgi:DNA-binding LacI/PurR family transcriptional regulator
VQPALPTVRVPAEEMWRLAAERVIDALRGTEVPRATEIEVALVVRDAAGLRAAA